MSLDIGLFELARRLDGKVSGGQVLCPGPGHSDVDASLAVRLDPDAPDGFVVESFAGDDWKQCRDYVREKLGLPPWKPNGSNGHGKANAVRRKTVATYDYRDRNGRLIYQVVRQEPKSFKQRRPDPDGEDGWTWNLKGVRREPYRLPELLRAVAEGRTIYIPEGEKDVDTLYERGRSATCNSGGAGKGKWKHYFAGYFKGAKIVILPDADVPGRKHGQDVAASLAPVASTVRVLEMPDGAKDVTEWIEASHTIEELDEIAAAAPIWQPPGSGAGGKSNQPGDDEAEAVIIELAAMRPLERAKKRKEAAEKLGIGLGDLDRAVKELVKGNKTQADKLVEIATQETDLYHTSDGSCFADIRRDGHRETWALRSKGFKRWLARRYHEHTERAANAEALQSALNVIEGKAQFDGEQRDVYVRVGGHGDDHIYIDLGDETWRAIEVTPYGWRVIPEPPVRFRRRAGIKPLPVPERGGSIELLRPYLSLHADRDFILTVAWLLAALRPCGPYPVASISGEQGSAKSTFAAILRALVDPNAAALRALPREDRDLFIAAANGYVLAFDNLSGIPAWVSDTLCRLATGGGFATRQLHTDQDEILFDAQRPIILNGISDYVERPDLADRALLITLEPILDTKRVSERKLWREFKRARPLILSALFDAVAYGLKTLPDVTLTRSPRMADFAEWIVACEGSLWPSETFMMAYQGSLDDAVETVLEADPVAVQVRRFMADRKSWKGSAAELLAELNGIVPEDTRRSRGSNGWPTVPHVLSGRLRRAATFLRKVRIEVHFDREGHGGPRNITLSAISEYGSKTASPASPARHQGENASQGNGLHGDARGGACADGDARSVTSVTMAIQAGDARGGAGDAHGDAPGRTSVCKKIEKNQVLRPPGDAGDAGDAVLPLFSESEKEGGPSAGDDEPPPSGSSGRCGRLRI